MLSSNSLITLGLCPIVLIAFSYGHGIFNILNMKLIQTTASDKSALIKISFDEAIRTIVRVENALLERNLRCQPNSSFGSLFATVRRLVKDSEMLSDERWRETFLRANEAVRIANAIEEALHDAGAEEIIHRVTRSNMDLATRQQSQGKDALWELEIYRRLKLGGSSVSFCEPDLVVSLGDAFGDYAIACKKVYAENSVDNAFRFGCKQLAKHGRPGVVAINLDDLAPERKIWTSPTKCILQKRLDEMNSAFIKAHFSAVSVREDCDGVLVATSIISDVPDMNPPINVTRSTAVWYCGKGEDAELRFNAFCKRLDGVFTPQVTCL